MYVNDLTPELRKKVSDAFSDINKQIGDVTYTEEEREQLKEFYRSTLSSNRIWTQETAELITAFLVSAIKNYKGDWTGKEFWDRISPQIGRKPDYNNDLPAIGDALKNRRRPLFISKNVHKYVESLFYQAYSPQTSVKSFIKLAWSLYTNPDVFDLTYFDSDADASLCSAIIRSLNNHYKGTDFDADFVFESSTYSIRAGLRYAFEQDHYGAVTILRRILRYIDTIYHHREKIDEEAEGFLGQLCNESVPRLIASYIEPDFSRRTPRARETIDDIDRIKASYLIHEGSLNVYFPKIRLFRDDQQFKNATVKLYFSSDAGMMEIAKKDYPCVGEDYKHTLREIFFPIDEHLDLFGNEISLVATLSFDDYEPVYNSKRSLFRKFLVLKDDTEAKSTLLNPDVYKVVYPTNFSPNTNIHSREEPTISSGHMLDMSFNEGDRISFNGYYVFFGKKETGAHFFFNEENTLEMNGIVFKGNSPEPYAVYKSLGNLIIRTDDAIRPDHLDIQVYSDDGTSVYRCPVTSLESDNGVYSCPIEKTLLEAEKQDVYLFVITIKDQSTGKYYYNRHITVLPDITVSRGESPYICGFSNKTSITFSGQTYTVSGGVQNEFEEIDTKIGIAEVQLPFFSWKINQGEIHRSEIDENLPLLLEEFQSNDILFVKTFFEDVRVFCGENEILESDRKGQYLLGKFVNSPAGHNAFINGESFYAMVQTEDGEFRFPLFSTSSEPYFLDEDPDSFIFFENGTLLFNVKNNFHGSESTRFQITLKSQSSKGCEYKEEGDLHNGVTISGISADVYDVSVSYKGPYESDDCWTNIWSDELELGDLNEIRFRDIAKINITKICRHKTKNLYLTNLSYVCDDGFGLRYRCKLYSGSAIRGEYCEFVIDYNTRLSSSNIPISNLYYKDNDEMKEFSFDTTDGSLSKHQIDDERYHECLSIYSKTE